jgi:hypothetical protein
MLRTTTSQANRFILHKNYLGRRHAADLSVLLKELVGLPAGDSLSAPLAMRARFNNFSPGHLAEASLPVTCLMRSEPYIVSAHRLVVWHAATARQRNQAINAELRPWGIESNAELAPVADEVLARLNDEPATEAQLLARISPGLVQSLQRETRGGRQQSTTNVALALFFLRLTNRVVATYSTANWQAAEMVYEPFNRRYPDLNLAGLPSEADAQLALVRDYIAAFGPVTEADVSFWTGLGKSETARAMGALSGETVMTMVQGLPGMLLTLKSQAAALSSVATDGEPIVNALPANDPYTIAHRASRTRYFRDQKLQRRVFDNSGAARPAFVVDGQIVGIWDWQPDDGGQYRLSWEMLAKADPATLRLIEAEIGRLDAFFNFQW